MSHAEAVHTLQPAAGATDQIVQFTAQLRYDALPEEARHYARRHLLDTVGVMIAGAGGTIATQAENVIKAAAGQLNVQPHVLDHAIWRYESSKASGPPPVGGQSAYGG